VDYTSKEAESEAISACPGVLAKSEPPGPGPWNKRTNIECLGIRRQKEQTRLEIRWVHSDATLADGPTKDEAAKVLLELFKQCQKWRLLDDPLHGSARRRKAAGIDKLDHGPPVDEAILDDMLAELVHFVKDEATTTSIAGMVVLWGQT